MQAPMPKAVLTHKPTEPSPVIEGARQVAARTAEALLVVLLMASLVFFVMRLVPGDPARLVLGDQATPAQLAALRHKLDLDQPMYVQYARFLKGLATLDFGESLRRPGVSALARVKLAMLPTAALAGFAVALGAAMGVLGAVLAAGPFLGPRRRIIDRLLVVVSASPLLAFAPLVTYLFAARWRVLPLPGDPDAGALGLLFAGGLLSIPLAAQVGRVGRASLEALGGAPFLSAARARGASRARVWLLHAVPAASGPILTVVATQLGALLGGAVVIERLFERPGLGTLLIEAYASRDLPVLEAAVVAAGVLFVVVQVLAATLHALIDPRVRR
jgi:peptide/nickel transport system permease protein